MSVAVFVTYLGWASFQRRCLCKKKHLTLQGWISEGLRLHLGLRRRSIVSRWLMKRQDFLGRGCSLWGDKKEWRKVGYSKKLPSFGTNVRTSEAWRRQPGWGWRVGWPDCKRAHVLWKRRWTYFCRYGWTIKDVLRERSMIRLAVAVRQVDWRDLAEANARVQRGLIRGWAKIVAGDIEVRNYAWLFWGSCADTEGRTLQGPLGFWFGVWSMAVTVPRQ